jgi:hypothetical protein
MMFNKRNVPANFYVYLYMRDDGTPYYVGKGKGKRAWNRTARAVSPPVNDEKIKIVAHRLSEFEAFLLEVKLVERYGRIDLGTGILRNGTRGGEGSAGHVPTKERRQQQREIMLKKVEDGEFNYPSNELKGKKQTAEQIKKRITVHIGAKRPKLTGDKIRKKATGRVQTVDIIKKRILYRTCEHCGSVVDKGNYTRWHGDKCKHKQHTINN